MQKTYKRTLGSAHLTKTRKLITGRKVIFSLVVTSTGITILWSTLRIAQQIKTPPHKRSFIPNQLPTIPDLGVSEAIDKLNPNAEINVPFIRNDSLYLYQDHEEKLVAQPKRGNSLTSSYEYIFPALSPDNKYVGFLEFPEDSRTGVLRILDIKTNTISETSYKTFGAWWKWNRFNQIELSVESTFKTPEGKQGYRLDYIIYDPESGQELVRKPLSEIGKQESIKAFPLYGDKKRIEKRKEGFYLVDTIAEREILLVRSREARSFQGWSPDGTYALFHSTKKPRETNEGISSIWLAVNTDTVHELWKEIPVYYGVAGGEMSVGPQWYFNDGFMIYCSMHLSFMDGRKPLRLITRGGGGCHNEDGFVATSPNGQYAFIRFSDRYELHIRENSEHISSQAIEKPQGLVYPKRFSWINNDYMIIYAFESPAVYLFDRSSMTIQPIH